MSLGQNAKWKKVMSDAPEFTFADIVMKVNRTNGKVKSLYLRCQIENCFCLVLIMHTFQSECNYLSVLTGLVVIMSSEWLHSEHRIISETHCCQCVTMFDGRGN